FGIASSINVKVVPWAPVALRFSSNLVTSSDPVTGTVTLGTAAPVGGATVTLASNNVHAYAPSNVVVAAGSTVATFTLHATNVTANQSATITATYAGATAQASITVGPGAPPPCCPGGCAAGKVCNASCQCVLPKL